MCNNNMTTVKYHLQRNQIFLLGICKYDLKLEVKCKSNMYFLEFSFALFTPEIQVIHKNVIFFK